MSKASLEVTMKRLHHSAVWFLGLCTVALALASGCGGETGGGTGGSGSTGSSGSSTTTSSGSGAGGGTACGGFTGNSCGPTEYCDFPRNTCGAADEQGTCKARPQACPDIYSPTCACDGKVYGNDCDAAGQGTDLSNFGDCPPPNPGLFNCGPTFCATNQQYCILTTSDVGGEPDSYGCGNLPAGCAVPATCDCLKGEPCGSICEVLSNGQLRLTCPGG
jgi:hypothetical protein